MEIQEQHPKASDDDWGQVGDFSDDDSFVSSEGLIDVEPSANRSDVEIREARRLTEGDNNSIQIWRNVILFMVRSACTSHYTFVCLRNLSSTLIALLVPIASSDGYVRHRADLYLPRPFRH